MSDLPTTNIVNALRQTQYELHYKMREAAADALEAMQQENERLQATIDRYWSMPVAATVKQQAERIEQLEAAIGDVYQCWLRSPDIVTWGGVFPRLFEALKGKQALGEKE